MPHLQAGNDADATSVVSVEKTPRRVSETLPIMAATKKQSLEIKGEDDSYDSDDVGHRTPSVKKQVITPPPVSSGAAAASPPSSPKPTKGPILSIYGDTRLFSSPIQVKKRTRDGESKDESGDDSSSAASQQEQEKTTPAAQSPSFEKLNKEKDQDDDSSVPSKKPRIASSPEPTKSQGSVQARKPIISPTSSNENKEDDESTSQFSYGSAATPYYGRQAFQHRYPHSSPHHSPYHHPHHHPYGGHGYHQYPPPTYYGGGMYPPHHPPHAHYGAPPPPHPNMYYSQYHHPHYPPRPPMMSPIRVAQRQFPMRRTVSTPASDASSQASSSKSSTAPSPSPSDCKEAPIASVAEWQRAAVSTGKPPSAKRCVPLNDPIPSKSWNPSDTSKDMKLPEFHKIVNYPDYLAKARGGTCAETAKSAAEGKKHCVMCGEPRYSSASSLANKARTPKSDSETEHIIPRQNKGLCTACDVTVWVMTEQGNLEIKWCKGCKNFRPWAAFGDKGLATKCTKCRERQKEKYALQKDAATKKQQRRSWEASALEEGHLEAANGLRSLIHAATAN